MLTVEESFNKRCKEKQACGCIPEGKGCRLGGGRIMANHFEQRLG